MDHNDLHVIPGMKIVILSSKVMANHASISNHGQKNH